jgi:putative glutamine amidotransferase
MRPLIAVTTTASHAGAGYRTPQLMLGSLYLAAVETIEGAALLVTPAHRGASVERLMDIADGLILSGGEDVDPARYGQAPHPKLGMVSRERDEVEFAALERALERELPVLAICRGMQLLNVAFGGTLYQDLPSLRDGGLIHEQDAPITKRWHAVEVEEGSRPAEIFGETKLFINSFHHQGVDRLGEGLRAWGWAEDGLVEGIEAADHPWVVGVQWHPERGEAEVPGDPLHPDHCLFQAFGEAVRERAESR